MLWSDRGYANLSIVVIADDLTGANDSGVQFARKGLRTAVVLKEHVKEDQTDYEVLIHDTDSRSVLPAIAYERTKAVLKRQGTEQIDLLYKKIDSTMRGNVGAELDAVYDAAEPHFVFFTPAYPQNGRQVKDGLLYLNGSLLHETEFARDPKTPMRESYIPAIVESQSKRKVGLVSGTLLHEGRDALMERLEVFRREGKPYILFDAWTEEDLTLIAEAALELPCRIVYAGSAGLANALVSGSHSVATTRLNRTAQPVLTVIGSVNPRSREQLNALLTLSGVVGIELRAQVAVRDEVAIQRELERILSEAASTTGSRGIVLFTSGDMQAVVESGQAQGLTPSQVSDRIACLLGRAAAGLIVHHQVERVTLTGGDTAKQVCECLNIARFEPLDEIEPGVPLGKLVGGRTLYGVTKAGGFGSEQVLVRALSILEGESST